MANLTIPLTQRDERAEASLSLGITYARFQHGWVYYDILAATSGHPLLNGAGLKARGLSIEAAPGTVTACEDEFCSLLPAMRRFAETRSFQEWTPTDPDVTLTMKMTEEGGGAFVSLELEIDAYQWVGVTAYGRSMVRLGFECPLGAFHQFYQDLRAEFVAFRAANDIAGYNTAHGFNRPEHEWF